MDQGVNYKVVTLGEGQVGKTSILTRFVNDQFNDQTQRTINAYYMEKSLKVNGQPINLCIWDTAGQEKYDALAPVYYKNADAAVLVYDVTVKETLLKVQKWQKEIKENAYENVVLVMVGNKCDLFLQSQVPKNEAEELAAQLGAKHFFTSAKSSQGLQDMFQYIAEQIFKKDKKSRRKSRLQVMNKEQKVNEDKSSCC